MIPRSLAAAIQEDLRAKMVLVSGPRQVGKTTLARQVLDSFAGTRHLYYNWDRLEHRRIIRGLAWSRKARAVALDEVHKYPRWKRLLKGFFDTEGTRQALLVTGSARLDLYRRGGESLMGRYAGYRLHPFSFGELARGGRPPDRKTLSNPAAWTRVRVPGRRGLLKDLMVLGGFPEPYVSGSERRARRWRLTRRELLLRQEIRDLTAIREVALVEHLMDLLRERIGAPLSVQSLCEDLQVSHKTVSSWIEALSSLFAVFRVRPFGGRLARTLRKEAKVYFWDWAEAPPGGPRFENLVASHLLKLCHWMRDVEGLRAELCYVRDREKREVDFLLVLERKPWVLIEAKLAPDPKARSLEYFRTRLDVPHAIQVVEQPDARTPGARAADMILSALP